MPGKRRQLQQQPQGKSSTLTWKSLVGVFGYARRALGLVWETSRGVTIALGVGAVVSGLAPTAMAWAGKRLVDSIVQAAATNATADRDAALVWVAVEAGLALLLMISTRLLSILRSLLRAQLGNRINVMILQKSLALDLTQFEDSETYDMLTRARREASSRPLSMVMRTFSLAQGAIALVGLLGLLAAFSPFALAVLVGAALPAFIAEAKFSGDAFRLFRWRTPETREQVYVETVLAREDHAKEVKLYDLGPRLLRRYQDIFDRVFADDRALSWRRGLWGIGLGVLGAAAFYGMYVWIALAAIEREITLGAMTMYVVVFRQAQSTMGNLLSDVGGLYEDNLYLSTLYELLDLPVRGAAAAKNGGATSGPEPADGVRFEHVSFTYPGAATPALADVSLHVPPGSKLAIVGENGSGKTTLIKLLAGLYTPTSGRVLVDGLPIGEWDQATLRRRIGVIFQDFVRYQLTVGENIGAGDDRAYDDRARWADAAEKGLAAPVIAELPAQYDTQLGKWFREGRELSLGQWQKVALARAFMRKDADILVLDEPTASMDAAAEVAIFDRFRERTKDQIAIVISHRFSTVRMADRIVVLDGGKVVESGSHDELVAQGGRYATLFKLQARGYQ
ncbi:MAG TPA: ABC transporter ATP-binding protein [Kofleriaceae bacterium]|nr:ABC transporter ATP-binding protein [Kofleriaceae bacterium]